MISSNLVLFECNQIFKEPPITAAAIDRVVGHRLFIGLGKEISSRQAEEAARRNQIAFSVSVEETMIEGAFSIDKAMGSSN